MDLDIPVARLPTVRGRAAEGLERLGIRTLRHLLFHFPSRHEDRRVTTRVRDARVGSPAVFYGVVREIAMEEGFRRSRGRTRRVAITRATVADDSGALAVVWFHQRFLERQYPAGTRVALVGTPTGGAGGITLVAPEVERLTDRKEPLHVGRLVPIYPETAGVTSRQLRFLVSRALPLTPRLAEYLPGETRNEENLLTIQEAVRAVHFPNGEEELERARARLAFDELFLLQLAALVRKRRRMRTRARLLVVPDDVVDDAMERLPFSLTPSQREALRAIRDDLRRAVPMNRLLAGDVGSGKTVVAGLAALVAARAGAQAALAAPTEILAMQHAETLAAVFRPLGMRLALLTGGQGGAERAAAREKARAGDVDVLVGTHALFYEDNLFRHLGLVVIDEQHRFGVEQRAALTKSGATADERPHFLSLTATPIPRTLQLTAYGDVDVSLLDPRPGQRTVETRVVSPEERPAVYASLANQIRAGGQVFVICPRVEERDDEVRSVVSEFERLCDEVFAPFHVGMLHGKLSPEEKQRTMDAFRAGALDVLVASSVVEVGVDIPNATALLVEGAERFGLAQLHQLRGRVGRRGQRAVCSLASTSGEAAALDRLRVLERSTDGLAIAEEDLARRGPGNIYGTEQSGGVRLRVANIADMPFLLRVRGAAERLLDRDPTLAAAPLISRRVEQMNVTTHFE